MKRIRDERMQNVFSEEEMKIYKGMTKNSDVSKMQQENTIQNTVKKILNIPYKKIVNEMGEEVQITLQDRLVANVILKGVNTGDEKVLKTVAQLTGEYKDQVDVNLRNGEQLFGADAIKEED